MVGEREENLKKKHIYTKKTAEAVFFAYCTNTSLALVVLPLGVTHVA